MNKFNEYYNARNEITNIIKQDLLGPVTEDEKITGELPVNYYLVGKLYPQDAIKYDNPDIVQSMSEYKENDMEKSDFTEIFDEIALCNTSNPSSMGISFSVNNDIEKIKVIVSYAKYLPFEQEETEQTLEMSDEESEEDKTPKKKRKQYKREFYKYERILSVKNPKIEPPIEDSNVLLRVNRRKTYDDTNTTITVSLSNMKSKCEDIEEKSIFTLFQPEIRIEAIDKNTFSPIERNIYLAEPEEMDLLYYKMQSYAQGHGCAVSWDFDENKKYIKSIKSEFLPEYTVRQMKPSDDFKSDILSMKFISEAKKEDIVTGINKLCNEYSGWISKRESEIANYPKRLEKIAKDNLKKCRESCERIKVAGELIDKDKTIERAFKLANKAMYLQRRKQLEIKKKEEPIEWYPFQLAFFLQEIPSIALPNSDERKLVDLLWFPTGGGKTEAYLGIAAFTIFLRRLKYGTDGNGVAVFMRYTLRLLTFQQFERASALICACEQIRKAENIPGESMTIGLWAGEALTPNKIKDAEKYLNADDSSRKYDETIRKIGNPAQIKKCPWCGADIKEENYEIKNYKMIIKCPNQDCNFHSGLPIILIDEEIYQYPPTFVVATIDKFAQIALNDDAGALFGNCTNGKTFNPPDLIIQDELHLISGPLGTIAGLYECAIKKLTTSKEGYYPKIIASTATIKNAKDQIEKLYAADYKQFPAQGIDIEDSFFAVISKPEDKPSRKYLGCMGIGTSPTTMMIRVMTSLLFATRYLESKGTYSEDVIDAYWTITSYFNTLRELGGAIVRVIDDIQDRYKYLRDTKFKSLYPINDEKTYKKYMELTSRIPSEQIGASLHELESKYRKDNTTNPYDFLLASNMISVGVDVGRLGTMVVVGQPKLTAEYIQATSRVGRSNPGLVIATYNQAKSRDRSHFEQFTQYHQSFYKYVEATSITPFADRARDRALQTIYIMLCRYLIDDLRANDAAINYKKHDKNALELREIRDYIFEYVQNIDPNELDNVRSEIEEIEEEWNRLARTKNELIYKDYFCTDKALFDMDSDEESRFRALNSMRSVETTANLYVKE